MANGKAQIGLFVVLAVALAAIGWAIFHPRLAVTLPEPRLGGELSQSIDIDFYIDGSGSMRNFLPADAKIRRSGYYLLDFLTACEGTLREPPARGGWGDPRVRFWKFGGSVAPLPDQGDLSLLARHPEGYKDGKKTLPGFVEERTSIQVPIDHNASPPGRSGLKMIVTDLYQSNGAIEQPAIELAERYLKDSGAVAIYGVRNRYSGPVEDLPGLHGASLPDAADSMPFYIIIAGDRAADVYHAEEVLMTGSTGTALKQAFADKRAFFMYFSKDPGWRSHAQPQVNWRVGNGKEKSGAGELREHYHGSLALLSLREGKVGLTFSRQQPEAPADYEPTPVAKGVIVRALAEAAGPKGQKQSAEHSENESAEKAAKAQLCEAGLSVCVTIDRSRLHRGGEYLFHFEALAEAPSDTLDPDGPTIRNWSIDSGHVAEMAAGDRKFPPLPGLSEQHPGRTPNLSQFLKALQGRMFLIHNVVADPVRVATYDLYVEAK